MSRQHPPEYFVEGLSDISFGNGVFRVVFSQNETEDTSKDMVRFFVPASQLANLLRSIQGAALSLETAEIPDAVADEGIETIDDEKSEGSVWKRIESSLSPIKKLFDGSSS